MTKNNQHPTKETREGEAVFHLQTAQERHHHHTPTHLTASSSWREAIQSAVAAEVIAKLMKEGTTFGVGAVQKQLIIPAEVLEVSIFETVAAGF